MRLFFHISHNEKEQEARQLALGRAAIALGRKVLADNPRPSLSPIARYNTKKPSPREPDAGRMRMAIDRAKMSHERQHLERQHLSMADAHVAKAERVIREQMAILEKLSCDGHDTKLAEETLTAFEANLQVLREHRDLIIRTIEEDANSH